MNGLTGEQIQLISGIVLTGLGIIGYTRKEVKGELWNTFAVLLTGTGVFMLIKLIPDNDWVDENLLFVALGIALSIMVIKMDGQISTLIGLLILGGLCYIAWSIAPNSWKDWVGYVWGEFLEFGAMFLGLFGIDL